VNSISHKNIFPVHRYIQVSTLRRQRGSSDDLRANPTKL
jgi:hypothetical protein